MTRVFLSASFPSGDRGRAVAPYRPGDIGLAASSAAEAVLRAGANLVFGGHPTVSPLVLQIAGLLNAGRQVEIWQSAWFQEEVTAEVLRLVEEEHALLVTVPKRADRQSSLALLRHRMLAGDFAAGFFVGGMDGIADELHLFAELHPDTPAYLFVTPGGMTARLAEDRDPPTLNTSGRPWPVRALQGRAYGALALEALRGVGMDVQDRPGEL